MTRKLTFKLDGKTFRRLRTRFGKFCCRKCGEDFKMGDEVRIIPAARRKTSHTHHYHESCFEMMLNE